MQGGGQRQSRNRSSWSFPPRRVLLSAIRRAESNRKDVEKPTEKRASPPTMLPCSGQGHFRDPLVSKSTIKFSPRSCGSARGLLRAHPRTPLPRWGEGRVRAFQDPFLTVNKISGPCDPDDPGPKDIRAESPIASNPRPAFGKATESQTGPAHAPNDAEARISNPPCTWQSSNADRWVLRDHSRFPDSFQFLPIGPTRREEQLPSESWQPSTYTPP